MEETTQLKYRVNF